VKYIWVTLWPTYSSTYNTMKRTSIITFLALFSLLVNAQYQITTKEKKNDGYINPIFRGDYPLVFRILSGFNDMAFKRYDQLAARYECSA
jgi:hypothetical protein